LLFGALHDQLLQPKSQTDDSEQEHKDHLVSTNQSSLAEHNAKPNRKILQKRNHNSTHLNHPMCPIQQSCDVDTNQRHQNQTEIRKHRVASANVERIEKHPAKAALAGEPLERRPGVGDRDELRALSAGVLPEITE